VISPLHNYLAAVFPSTHSVLGTRLHVFTLGHAMLLHRLGSPIIERQPAELADLVLFVELCRLPFKEAVRQSRRGVFGWRLWWLHFKWRWLSVADELKVRAALDLYLDQAHSAPLAWSELGKGGRKSGSPMLQSIKVTLMARLNKSEAEALETSLAVATWDHFAFWEQEGSVKIANDTDAALLEMTRQLEREQEEGKLAVGQPRAISEMPQATTSSPTGGNTKPASSSNANNSAPAPEGDAGNRLEGR
jgi:hypothetical protein